ncbi:heme binding lipoprotein precursor HmuY-family [Tenacibaculum maritimum]|uniref:hypothetical protein n=1 Tax=Tenacibaculum maritimum TaxID=107401 RepID=UPI0012E4A4D0|nr:hypothetical protein [Tenacibaculum maritimum]CAA0215999.1 heme binding lipoprotein precursor HmuY-family [Tenacibaculum maritimum]
MKKISLLTTVLYTMLLLVLTSSCSKENLVLSDGNSNTEHPDAGNSGTDNPNPEDPNVTTPDTFTIQTTAIGNEKETAEQTGIFQKFSFAKGGVVDGSSDDWDFAIRGRAILVNGLDQFSTKTRIGLINEPKRTKDVAVYVDDDLFETRTTALDLPSNLYFQDCFDIGGITGITTAISWLPRRGDYDPRKVWYFRSSQDKSLLLLKPIVFVFKTHDGHFAKMAIKELKRTNTNFEEKESLEYVIQYYYNPKKGNPSLKA